MFHAIFPHKPEQEKSVDVSTTSTCRRQKKNRGERFFESSCLPTVFPEEGSFLGGGGKRLDPGEGVARLNRPPGLPSRPMVTKGTGGNGMRGFPFVFPLLLFLVASLLCWFIIIISSSWKGVDPPLTRLEHPSLGPFLGIISSLPSSSSSR